MKPHFHCLADTRTLLRDAIELRSKRWTVSLTHNSGVHNHIQASEREGFDLDLLNELEFLYSATGFFIGILVGLTGVGGGALMTPVLVLLFGVHPATAVGTDLLFAAITKSVGTVVHGRNKTIEWRIVRNLALGSIPASLLMIWWLSDSRGDTAAQGQSITFALGIVLLLTAVLLLFRNKIVSYVAQFRQRHHEETAGTTAILTTLLGLLIGALVTMTSVGAGAIGVTVLLVLYPHMKIRQIVGSDIVHAVPLTLLAGAGYWMIGSIDFSMLASLLLGSVPGVILGSFLSPRIPEHIIRPILAVTLAAVGLKMLL